MKEFFKSNKFKIIFTIIAGLLPFIFGLIHYFVPSPVFDNIYGYVFWIYAIPFLPVAITIIGLGFSRSAWDTSATIILLIVSMVYSYILGCLIYYLKKPKAIV